MRLESLVLSYQDYGAHKDTYKGEVRFKSEVGSIAINIGADLSAAVLAVCGKALKDHAANTADLLRANAVPLLGAPEEVTKDNGEV